MPKQRRVLVGILTASAVLVGGLLAAPWTPRLSTDISGDAALADAVRPLLQSPADRVSVAYLEGGSVPAGGIRSTAADMAIYAQAMLSGTAPGARALDPRWDTGDDGEQVGLGWFTQVSRESPKRSVTWHNGQTGGFASMAALERDAGRAVLIFSNVAAGQEEAALTLLKEGL